MKLFNWIYRSVMRWMDKRPPMETNEEESKKVLEKMEEYKKAAADEKEENRPK